jgi:hypothetical protein
MSAHYEYSLLYGYHGYAEESGEMHVFIHSTAASSVVLHAGHELEALDSLGAEGWRLVSERNFARHTSNRFPGSFQGSLVEIFGSRFDDRHGCAIDHLRFLRQIESTDS